MTTWTSLKNKQEMGWEENWYLHLPFLILNLLTDYRYIYCFQAQMSIICYVCISIQMHMPKCVCRPEDSIGDLLFSALLFETYSLTEPGVYHISYTDRTANFRATPITHCLPSTMIAGICIITTNFPLLYVSFWKSEFLMLTQHFPH